MNEAAARIKINKLLEAAGWRFFDTDDGPANICLEVNVKFKPADLDALGENFEKTGSGSIDFLLLDDKGFPLIVLEAKREDLSPLTGKGAGSEIRPLPKLPLRHPFQWQPALLLGPPARQSPPHPRLSHAGIGAGL